MIASKTRINTLGIESRWRATADASRMPSQPALSRQPVAQEVSASVEEMSAQVEETLAAAHSLSDMSEGM